MNAVLVVGEALIDIVCRPGEQGDASPGGSPANVALGLGRLGNDVTLLTQLGDDLYGETVRAWLGDADVEVIAVDAERTATATATVDASGVATYEFDLDWSLVGLNPASTGVPEAGFTHTGSIAALVEPGASRVREMLVEKKAVSLISFDPNVRPTLLSDHAAAIRDIEAFVSSADVVKASEEDLAWLYPGSEPAEIARTWLARGPGIVVITLGEHGAFAVSSAGLVQVPAITTSVADTVGAGDAFMSALIHGLIEREFNGAQSRVRLGGIDSDALESLLAFAVRAAAIAVSRPGADPPTLSELR